MVQYGPTGQSESTGGASFNIFMFSGLTLNLPPRFFLDPFNLHLLHLQHLYYRLLQHLYYRRLHLRTGYDAGLALGVWQRLC